MIIMSMGLFRDISIWESTFQEDCDSQIASTKKISVIIMWDEVLFSYKLSTF